MAIQAADLPLGSVVATQENHYTALQEKDRRFWFQKRNPNWPGTDYAVIVRRTDEQIQALLDDGTATVHREGLV